ncbi:MAG: hypothetical protein ACYC5O_03645 [Anaerolineae bacterium]
MTVTMRNGESQGLEARLEAHFGAPAPDPAFVVRLQERLSTSTSPALPHVGPLAGPARGAWRRWGLAAAVIVVALAGALAAVGPRTALAQLRQWLGYVPGIGFVDLENSRVLPAPVAVTQGTVTLTVEQALARPGETTVRLRIDGLPAEPAASAGPDDPGLALLLPDGQVLAATGWRARWGEATVTFPPLPESVFRADLTVARLPLVAAGLAPEHWRVPLVLRPAGGDAMPAAVVAPYSPALPPQTRNGVTLAVAGVAHSAAETALTLRVQWPGQAWDSADPNGMTLRDDLGHVYGGGVGASPAASVAVLTAREQVGSDGTTAAAPPDANESTIVLSPLSASATSLTLTIDSMLFRLQEQTGFSLDIGDLALGERRAWDQTVVVAGLPVRITSVRLDQAPLDRGAGNLQEAYRLTLDLALAPASGGSRLVSVSAGVPVEGTTGCLGSRSNTADEMTRVTAEVYYREQPSGVLSLQLEGATLLVEGPWTFSWPVPGGATSPISPLTLRPDAGQTRDGLTLRIEEVVETDLVTAVTLGLRDAPAGTTLSRPLATVPGSQLDLYRLTDDLGRRYEPGINTGWQPGSETTFDANRLIFPAMAPLSRRVTFDAPAIEVLRREESTVSFTLPAGLIRDQPLDEYGRGAPQAVDATLEIGGYRLRFTEARLVLVSGDVYLSVIGEPLPRGDGTRWPAGLQLAAATLPDGSRLPLDASSGGYAYADGNGGERLELLLDVADPETGDIAAGTYTIEVSGLREGVRGPWRLSWERRP